MKVFDLVCKWILVLVCGYFMVRCFDAELFIPAFIFGVLGLCSFLYKGDLGKDGRNV